MTGLAIKAAGRALAAAMPAAALVISGVLAWTDARAQGGQCSPYAIGLGRTYEIDTKGGPRFGNNQYPGRPFLNDHEIVLTFDDGPHTQYTPQILNVLDAHCTKATFFMVGRRALHSPELVREVGRRGHTVATHSWTHQDQAKISREQALAELELGISGVQRAYGAPAAPFFRFPYLSDPAASQAHLRSRNTGIFSIDIDSYDFKTRSPTVVIRNVMKQLDAKKRGIILFHDIQPSTAGALNQLLAELKAKGYRVVHMVPRQGQVTLAQYDKQVDRDAGARRFTSLPPPVSQRGVVSPYWEVRVFEGPGRQPRVLQQTGQEPMPQPVPAVVGGPQSPGLPSAPRPRPRDREVDWRTQSFGNN